MPIPNFPSYGRVPARPKLKELERLLQPLLSESQYINVAGAARLVAAGLRSLNASRNSAAWEEDEHLRKVDEHARFPVTLAALFDLICNVEYLHGRVGTEGWIYCDRYRESDERSPAAYFGFLKQCPRCCLDRGLEPRKKTGLAGVQHKPSSHHIGEITTAVMMLLVEVLGRSAASPLQVALVSKQSHDVDAVAFRDDLLVLFEIKASPLVSFPVRAALPRPRTRSSADGTEELAQHTAVSVDYADLDLDLFFPHRDLGIPLAGADRADWPYPAVKDWIASPNNFLAFLSAWCEVYDAYRVPKTLRQGRQIALGYLANGWGDQIDSNKTKPGLSRTDDIKKGTYQLLKYGAYYRDGSPNLAIRGALAANVDPVFLYDDYLAKLVDVRWGRNDKFEPIDPDGAALRIAAEDLYFLYDAVLTFNRPSINDPMLREAFDFAAADRALHEGHLDDLLDGWLEDKTEDPDG